MVTNAWRKLDVGRPQLDETLTKGDRLVGRAAVVFARLRLVGDRLQALLLGEVSEAVAREQTDGRRETRQVAWSENHRGRKEQGPCLAELPTWHSSPQRFPRLTGAA